MISRFRKLSLASSACMAVLSAAASMGAHAAETPSDHPALAPMRDVVVTYRFKVDSQPGATKQKVKAALPEGTVNVSYSAEGNRLRMDPVGQSTVTILDRIAQRVTLIDMHTRSYVQLLPMSGLSNPFMLNLNMTFHAAGKGKIAGHECRYWGIETPKGKAQACVTDDGVILLEAGVDSDGIPGHMEAVDVSYRDLPASTFEPPVGFRKLQLPAPQARQGQPVPGAKAEAQPNSAPRPSPDTTQPPLSNDSAGDGSVIRSDQPSSVAH